jgi:hypothetical protein
MPEPEHDFVDTFTNPAVIGPAACRAAQPERGRRAGRDPLSGERLEESRSAVDRAELRDLLAELDRVRALLNSALADNGRLLNEWARYEGVVGSYGGVFCRTCHVEVQPGTEGCPRHSPTVIGRTLYRMHEESRAMPEGERNRRAYELLDAVLPLLAAVLDPVDHKEGCRPHDCRCGCARRQECPDCHRCVCWRSECCAGKAVRWRAEDRWARLVAEVEGPAGACAGCA